MENKRFVLIKLFALLLSTAAILQAFTKMQTPQSVTDFYKGMEKLASVNDPNTAKYICKSMKESFFPIEGSPSGVNIPNDFHFFDYDKKNSLTHEDRTLSTSLYVDRLEEYLFKEKVMRITCNFLRSEDAGELPEFKKGKLSASVSLIASYVNKTYRIGGLERIFNDTVYSDVSSGKISEIRNGFGQVKIADVKTLKINAALAYRLKRYHEAYRIYEQIISISPQDDDALYRIGLMTYYQQGCDFTRKVAHNKGKSYVEKAKYTSDFRSPIKEKAENVLHHWEYPND